MRRGDLGLTYLPLDAARPQLAFALSRRFGNAVTRNRCRRRLREAFRARWRRGALAPGAYLVSVFGPPEQLEGPALEGQVSAVLDALSQRLAA